MIEVNQLVKSYGNRRVLDGLEFQVRKGAVTAFLGANGAGKTTTLDILCGCLGKDAGRVLIEGQDLDTHLFEITSRIGYLPENPPVYGELRVHEALAFAGNIRRLTAAQLKTKIPQLLGLLSLEMVKQRLVKNLSKGMKQRLGFAQALIHEPSVLILDEPTDGLDPEQILEFRRIIKDLACDRTILLSSHNLAQVEGICDHVIILKEGRVNASDKLETLIEQISSTRTYHLQLQSNLDGLIEHISGSKFLQDLPGFLRVKKCDKNQGTLELEFPARGYEPILDRVIESILTRNCGLRLLKLEKSSLEDIYFDVTKR